MILQLIAGLTDRFFLKFSVRTYTNKVVRNLGTESAHPKNVIVYPHGIMNHVESSKVAIVDVLKRVCLQR